VPDDLEQRVARHYGVAGLAARILGGLEAAGLDPDRLTVETLPAVDELHIGGRPATADAVGRLGLMASDHVLDVGCGLGGATRYMAATVGCRVTGLDLTPEYIEVAQMLAERTGLSDPIAYRVGSALAMPFADAAFDAAITLHVAMNIADRAGLYAEIARVLKAGAPLAVYDVMLGQGQGLAYPVPWADTPATSHLRTPQQMRSLLEAADFAIEHVEDRTQYRSGLRPRAGRQGRGRRPAAAGPAPRHARQPAAAAEERARRACRRRHRPRARDRAQDLSAKRAP
jgi:MPBQ/MSBQ methyltransferase